jgi:general secretion pathway protein A
VYEKFFNLNIKPFELIPNPEFLYLSKPHKKAITYLNYGIKERIGFVLLTGEVGSGKTTIIRNLIKGLNSNVMLSKIFNTKVSSEQLLTMINEDFGMHVNGKDKITLLRELNDFLIEQYKNGYHSILIIDEAQNLTPELLEEIRMLSNLETDKHKLLQIVLVGQPELRKILLQPELRQLRQRISISCHISPLTRKETEEYILHRLEIAGNREAVSFYDGIIDVIHNFSRGIPRLINIVCDFLMLSAFVEETRELSLELVKEVIGEIEIENRYWQDEALENTFFGNETYLAPAVDKQDMMSINISKENFMRIIKEIISRINKLEHDFFKSHSNQNEKVEIFERLSTSEQLFNKFIANSKGDIDAIRNEIETTKEEITSLSGMLKDIQNEFAMLKNQLMNEEILKIKKERKKRGLFRELFFSSKKTTI